MQNAQKVVEFLLSLITAFKAPLAENGKFGFRDVLGFAPVLKSFPPIDAFKGALTELENADDAKRAELNAFIKQKFSIGNAGVEEKIEAGISILLRMSGAVPDIKVLAKKLESALPTGDTAKVGTVNVQAEQVNVQPQA